MICEECKGRGFVPVGWAGVYEKDYGMIKYEPCPECKGSGIAYCCDEAGSNPPNTWEDCDADRARLERQRAVPEAVEEGRRDGAPGDTDQRRMARMREEVFDRLSVTIKTLAER